MFTSYFGYFLSYPVSVFLFTVFTAGGGISDLIFSILAAFISMFFSIWILDLIPFLGKAKFEERTRFRRFIAGSVFGIIGALLNLFILSNFTFIWFVASSVVWPVLLYIYIFNQYKAETL